jgi:hypothetical protein
MKLCYGDTATFYTTEPGSYANDRVITSFSQVPVIFLQNTQFTHTNFRDDIDADAICYPDPSNTFVIDNNMRLEQMYIKIPLFGVADSKSWYKVDSVSVNRDHLLNNKIDNIELLLKKTKALEGVS